MACMRDRISAYEVLVGRPEGKRSFEGHMRRWVNNIKTDLQEVEWGNRLDLPGSR